MRKLRVLNIDDSEHDVELINRELVRMGYDLVAHRVADAKGLKTALQDRWDVILCDHSMPGFDPLTALDILRENDLDIPLIIVSGTIDEELAVAAMRAGAQDYLMKDNLVRLGAAIEREMKDSEHRRARRAAEAGLRASEERLRAIVESAADAIVIIDGDSVVQYANKSAERIFGYPLDELLDRPLTDLMPERYREMHRAGVRKYVETGQRTSDWELLEFEALHRDGHEFPVELSFNELEIDGRRHLTGIIRDITERKLAEIELHKSEERYRDLVENAHDVIYSHDLEGRFTSINRAIEPITGYNPDEMLRMNFADLLEPEELEKARSMLQLKLEGQPDTAYEIQIRRKDGERRTLEIRSKLMFQDGKAVGVQGIARDVTQRNKLEEQVGTWQRLESVGRLAGGIAHDFNNMLTAINGYADLGLRQLDPEHPVRRNLEEIKKAGERSAKLTGQLLAFSRKQVLMPELINLNETIADTRGMLERLIGKDVEFSVSLAPDLANVKVDPAQIAQIITNLAVNARDAMPSGGRLFIETANETITDETVAPGVTIPAGDYVRISVSDTGCGIPPEHVEHMFDPFFTTKEKGKGTGLGLATVYGIVKQSGGFITVESELGKGTTFRVLLPVSDETEQPKARKRKPQALGFGSERVLLVEDEAVVRNLAADVLRSCGYEVVEATDGVEALEIACAEDAAPFDLIVTDVRMPRLDGYGFAKEFATIAPTVPVLFMSGYDDDLGESRPKDVSNFLKKPFTSDELTRYVRELIDSDRRRTG